MCGIPCGDPLHLSAPRAGRKLQQQESASLQVNYSLKGVLWKSITRLRSLPKCQCAKGHLGQPLNIFCLTDMQLICGICATRGEHTKHVFCSIEDAYAQERTPLSPSSRALRPDVPGDALSRLDTLETSKGSLYSC